MIISDCLRQRRQLDDDLTHVLNKGGHGVRSPVDGLQAGLYRLYNSEWVIGEKMQKKLDEK